MSNNLRPPRPNTRQWLLIAVFFVTPLGITGCASVSQDVDAYYRQMAYNYREAQDKAKVDELSLDNEAKVLAATGDFRRHKKVQRELDKVKAWDAKCEKQAARFEKAAVWTEAHFHLARPPIPDGPPSTRGPEDQAVLQASGAKSP
jgi:hypothetical protein